MKTVRWLKIIAVLIIALGLFRPVHSHAQIPPFPTDPFLDSWSFYDPTNWYSDLGYAPIAFTNIVCDESSWASEDGVLDCNGLILDSTNAALLNYRVVEDNGRTNLSLTEGTLWFWFSPDWGSTNLDDGSTGPGDWGRFVDVGAYTTNAAYGWWSLYVDPAGDNIYFSGQTNGVWTNYLNAPISWTANSWHLIGLTYTPTNSILYIDDQVATNGLGVTYWPGHDAQTNGFFLGSDFSGIEQAHGEFVDFEAWNIVFGGDEFSAYYDEMYSELPGTGFMPGGGFGGADFSPPDLGGGGGGGGGLPDYDYGTNLWLYIAGIQTNTIGLFLINTAPDVLYEMQSKTDLTLTDWNSEGFVNGSELTNFTEMDIAQGDRTQNLFFRAKSWADDTGTGIPDWWWLQYFGQITNVDGYAADPAGDGYTDLQKFQLGLNPNNYYNPNAPSGFFGCLDSGETNVFLEWSPSPGPVVNYIVQRGILDTNGNYVYSQFLVSSNTTFFEDVDAITNDNAWNDIYNLQAIYPDGSLTAVDTWYAADAQYGPENFAPDGAPTPNDFYAYATATGTNVSLAWTPPIGGAAPTNYIILRGVLNPTNHTYSYSQIATVNVNTTYFQDVGVINNTNAWNDVYDIEAVYPGGALSQLVSASINTNQPPPAGLSAAVDSTGTNVVISWSPPHYGSPTNYIILRGVFNPSTFDYAYSQIGEVNASTSSFTDTGAITGNNSYNNSYEVEAVYPGGNLSQFDYSYLPGPPSYSRFNANVYITAYLVRNGTGRWQVMFSGFPTNSAQTIQLTWTDPDDNVTSQNISTTNLINGVYPIADINVVNLLGDSLSVQLFGPNGEPGQVAQAGVLADDAPYFVDGRQHMKQNLNFFVRAASLHQPFGGTFNDFNYSVQLIQSATNFEEFSFLHRAGNYSGGAWTALDNLWPFAANYYLFNFFLDTNNYTRFEFGNNFFYSQFTFTPNFATNMPAPPILTEGDPFWIFQPGFAPNYDDDTGQSLGRPDDWGVTATNFIGGFATTAILQSGLHNLFGLPEETGCIIGGQTIIGVGVVVTNVFHVLAPGGSVTITNSANSDYGLGGYATQCPAPALQFANYYFAPLINSYDDTMSLPVVNQQPFPVPIDDSFNVTNQTPPLIVGTVGQPMILASWAKYSISNSSPTKYAYLGQYFNTNALLLDASGAVTTNSAGVLSPYGEFFPMQAGVAQLITMPDIDTGQQGTNVVHIISMNADANHDGTMNFSYNSPDFVSASKPFHFWANDDSDAGDYGGNDGIPGLTAAQQADGYNFQDRDNNQNPIYRVHGTRDLVDFFPVYINIGSLFQSNALSAGVSFTDTNYQFVLSQADGVLRFTYTDLTPTNYMNFLRDTNEAQFLGGIPGNTGTPGGASLTTISNSGVALAQFFISGIATNNQGIILVEAAASTTQPLVLTIYHGTNQIAQTSLPLSISGVEQMFRHKNLLLNIAPAKPDRLTDASVPNEPDTVDKNFVFLHGYNVLPNEARGVAADMFKRLYWSGSHAKFYAVTWEGADTKGTFPFYNKLTPNYHTNVVNAFQIAPLLANFIATLTNSGPVVVSAHSLGNMVALSAISDWKAPISQYFMLDAAVPVEAIDSSATTNMMIYSTWAGYSNRLFASSWYQIFPTNDARNTLAWNNRLGNLQSVDVYNFYSSGEEVLRTSTNDPPSSVLSKVFTQALGFWDGIPFGTFTWYWQEKGKGTCTQDWFLGSSHGGWRFPADSYGDPDPVPPATANSLSDATLETNSVFTFGSYFDMTVGPFPDLALLGSGGSAYAQTNRNRILSDAIPAMSIVAGANPVPRFSPPASPTERNFDMNALYENGWPQGRIGSEQNKWHHSDFHEMSYTFTYQLFNKLVTTGNLK